MGESTGEALMEFTGWITLQTVHDGGSGTELLIVLEVK